MTSDTHKRRKESDVGLCIVKVDVTEDKVFKFYKQELYTYKALLSKGLRVSFVFFFHRESQAQAVCVYAKIMQWLSRL